MSHSTNPHPPTCHPPRLITTRTSTFQLGTRFYCTCSLYLPGHGLGQTSSWTPKVWLILPLCLHLSLYSAGLLSALFSVWSGCRLCAPLLSSNILIWLQNISFVHWSLQTSGWLDSQMGVTCEKGCLPVATVVQPHRWFCPRPSQFSRT